MILSQSVENRISWCVLQSNLVNYILCRHINTIQEFLENVLSDVRGGEHLDWYDSWFNDSKFRTEVGFLVEYYGKVR